jgi:hypothetical protein
MQTKTATLKTPENKAKHKENERSKAEILWQTIFIEKRAEN